jgi:hypothetical protein
MSLPLSLVKLLSLDLFVLVPVSLCLFQLNPSLQSTQMDTHESRLMAASNVVAMASHTLIEPGVLGLGGALVMAGIKQVVCSFKKSTNLSVELIILA